MKQQAGIEYGSIAPVDAPEVRAWPLPMEVASFSAYSGQSRISRRMQLISAPEDETSTRAHTAGKSGDREVSISQRLSGPFWLRPAEAVVVLVMAIGARLFHLDHVPHKDELNHFLAARSLLENGTLEIVAGAEPYSRAWGFTYMVAGMFRMFGESLVAARLPSVIAGALLVLLLFLWVRWEAGRAGAWIAALLLTFAPISIQLSQWSRFYTLHALFFFIACLLTYRLLSRPYPDRAKAVLMALGAIASLIVAFHFQVTTVVGLAGLAAWAALLGVPELLRRYPQRRQRRWIVGGLIGLMAIVGVWLVVSGTAEWAWRRATFVDVWAEHDAGNVRFYHYLLLDLYPPLWALFPLAVLIAAATRFRAALLCVCVFGIALVAHSLTAWKTERYIFYVLPFFFALWGIAIGGALPWVRSRTDRLLWNTGLGANRSRTRSLLAWGLVGAVILFAAFSTPAASYGLKMMTVGDADWRWGGYRGNPDWVLAAEIIESEHDRAEVIVGSYDVPAVYSFGRIDYMLRGRSSAARETAPFAEWPKTGTTVIASAEELELVMRCHQDGLVVVERSHYRREWAVSPDMIEVLETRAEAIELPETRLFLFRWQTEAAADLDLCQPLARRGP